MTDTLRQQREQSLDVIQTALDEFRFGSISTAMRQLEDHADELERRLEQQEAVEADEGAAAGQTSEAQTDADSEASDGSQGEETGFLCPECGDELDTEQGMQSHVFQVHGDSDEEGRDDE